MSNARDRSEKTPGRHQSPSRVRKVVQRAKDAIGRDRDPLKAAEKAEKSLRELLATANPLKTTIREQLDDKIGDRPLDDGNRAASEARDGDGDVPFIGWSAPVEEDE